MSGEVTNKIYIFFISTFEFSFYYIQPRKEENFNTHNIWWSENIKFYIFTSENIKYTFYFINIFLYFITLYIINAYNYVLSSNLDYSTGLHLVPYSWYSSSESCLVTNI